MNNVAINLASKSSAWLLGSMGVLIVITGLACSGGGDVTGPANATGPSLVFRSGFEPDVVGSPENAFNGIEGIDLSIPPPNDWQADLEAHPHIGDFSIQYQGGNASQRYARFVSDPILPQNRVLQFWLKSPNVDGKKGRVQANLYGNDQLREMYLRYRVYLDPAFTVLYGEPGAPTFDWLTIFEAWNNANWTGEGQGFRISVNLVKTETGVVDALHFESHGQVMPAGKPGEKIWVQSNTDVDVPIGRWFTVEIYLRDGGVDTGRFWMAIETADDRVIVFDVRDTTHHPDMVNSDGFRHVNPMKLYTSGDLLAYVAGKDRALSILWDDWELWEGLPDNVDLLDGDDGTAR